eukprot:scaffold36523_cov163-Isochrysis_galbana.AAC.1
MWAEAGAGGSARGGTAGGGGAGGAPESFSQTAGAGEVGTLPRLPPAQPFMQTAVPLSARGLEALPSAEARAIGVCHAAPGAAAPPAESM